MMRAMLVVLVHVHVLAESVEKFKEATRANAGASRCEPGIAQFDAIQQADDPTRFVLIEVYRSTEASAAHKETNHYKTWRDTVAPMMAEPRVSVKYGDMDGAWQG
jgi:quinol monooxygenase YgiN